MMTVPRLHAAYLSRCATQRAVEVGAGAVVRGMTVGP
jgi:hypothetical protein